jgi:hypothetical protein
LINHRAPIYTFAEDTVFNSANLILASGNKVFAGKIIYSHYPHFSNISKQLTGQYSLLGDFGYTYQGLGYKDFLEKYKLQA